MNLNEWVKNYIKEVTHSHEYEDMSQMGEDENDPQEIKVGNYQTKYFHVCPGASALYKDIESKGVDMDMAERSARLQDALYFVEEHIQRDGYKPERDYVMVANNLAKNIMKLASMMNLTDEHSYIQGHVDTIESIVKHKGLEERIMELTEENVPTDPAKWSYYKSQAKEKFDVYPSAYANAWAAKQYKDAGGGWRTKKSEATPEEEDEFHRKLDKLVHKTFGHSSDEKKVNESVNEAKDMTFVDYLKVLDDKFLDAMKAVRGDNGSDTEIKPTRGDILQNFTLFRNYLSALTKKYKGDNTKLRFLTERANRLNEIIKSVNEANGTYFKAAYEAAEYAKEMAEKKGYQIDGDDWQTQIGFGGKYGRLRPGVGKTHSFSIGLTKNGKPQRKALNISLYGMDRGYELTYYIN